MIFTYLAFTAFMLTSTSLPLPPGIPAASTARSELGSITVAAEGSQDGYSRDKFPTWIIQSGNCDTREDVLARDGTAVVQGTDCSAKSGSWYSPYDGATWTSPSDVDIDHVVPLSNAWKSGASSWTTDQRQAFANDLDNPQLVAVTDNVNESKGDRGPDEWQPPLASFHCTYAEMYIRIKYLYDLTITSAEKTALSSMLDTC
ncbi:secreted protein [Rhizodiscina lignyota]|uniref:Secreted protein n=1 Tax=Rhizodiscina lignyota TaxID=1504668 RepID=A0A9P4M2U1_9PEZI|nr:secreted protein [Rhizodiscina lignyota]